MLKNSAFPLDHLPVFNMSNKLKSSENTFAHPSSTVGLKGRRGVTKGTTVHVSSILPTKNAAMSDPLGYGHLRTQPSHALLRPILNKHGSGPNSGFRGRKMTDAAHQLINTSEFSRKPGHNTTQLINPMQSCITSTLQPQMAVDFSKSLR